MQACLPGSSRVSGGPHACFSGWCVSVRPCRPHHTHRASQDPHSRVDSSHACRSAWALFHPAPQSSDTPSCRPRLSPQGGGKQGADTQALARLPRPGRDTHHLHSCFVGHAGSVSRVLCRSSGQRRSSSEGTPARSLMLGVGCGDRTIGAETTHIALVTSAPCRRSLEQALPLGPPFETPLTHSKSFCTTYVMQKY